VRQHETFLSYSSTFIVRSSFVLVLQGEFFVVYNDLNAAESRLQNESAHLIQFIQVSSEQTRPDKTPSRYLCQLCYIVVMWSSC
jgi:hypothetical protein